MGGKWIELTVIAVVATALFLVLAAFLRSIADPNYVFPPEMYVLFGGIVTAVTTIFTAVALKKNGKKNGNGTR